MLVVRMDQIAFKTTQPSLKIKKKTNKQHWPKSSVRRTANQYIQLSLAQDRGFYFAEVECHMHQ